MKVKLSVWVDQRIAQVIRDQASSASSTLSEQAAHLLERAVHQDLEQPIGVEVFIPAVLNAVRRELALRLEPVETLCTQNAIQTDAARRELFQLCVDRFGAETAARIRKTAWLEAKSNLETITRSKPSQSSST
jgi:hypothetical protein